MANEGVLRKIAPLELSKFRKIQVPGNRNLVWRTSWYIVNELFFRSAIVGLVPNQFKSRLLRAFGAVIGEGLVCKPRANIKYPWFLEIGDNVWIGEDVWIDNLCPVVIGNNVCLSQGARLLTGSHDWSKSDFPFFARSISIGDGVWVTAFRVVRPGVDIPPHMAVLGDVTASALRAHEVQGKSSELAP